MQFNPDPTKQATQVIFSCKKNKPAHPPIFFNGVIVSTELEQKQLGLILTENLSFTKHIYEKIKKADKHMVLSRKHLRIYLLQHSISYTKPSPEHTWTIATSFTINQQKSQIKDKC